MEVIANRPQVLGRDKNRRTTVIVPGDIVHTNATNRGTINSAIRVISIITKVILNPGETIKVIQIPGEDQLGTLTAITMMASEDQMMAETIRIQLRDGIAHIKY